MNPPDSKLKAIGRICFICFICFIFLYFIFFFTEPTLKSKACLKCLYFTIIIFDLCRYLEYFSYLYTIN